MTDLLDFKTKKDRDDFLIAIAVITLFFGFFTWLTGCENQTLIPEEVQAAVAPIIADKDKDGIPDKADNCPLLAGIALNDGCPADADGDMVYDTEDKCPHLAGPTTNAGCPLDGDQDGVPDGKDNCPELMGLPENDGCPADTDGDGVYDINDKCPEQIGTEANEGCPVKRTLPAAAAVPMVVDQDKDGIPDKVDNCPTIAGSKLNRGCPADSDGDKIYDADDKCPQVAGVAANNGCPADRDRDGVYDVNDKCPNEKGTVANGGCPELEAAEKALLLDAMQNVAFQTSSAELKPASKTVLNQIVGLMKKYGTSKLDINGHTDNVGGSSSNQILSEARAKSCYNYLVEAGIAKERITYKGFGDTTPIENNATLQGRQKNRRVEFNLHY